MARYERCERRRMPTSVRRSAYVAALLLGVACAEGTTLPEASSSDAAGVGGAAVGTSGVGGDVEQGSGGAPEGDGGRDSATSSSIATAASVGTSTNATTSSDGSGSGGTGVGGDGGDGGAGGVGGGGAGGNGAGGGGAGGPLRLFVLNENYGVTSYAHPAALDASMESITRLDVGGGTEIYGPRDLVVDAAGALLVLGQNDASVGIFDQALTATGTMLPDRKLTGNQTGFDTPSAMALDVDADVLFVVDGVLATADAILIFEGASQLDGNAAPDRAFHVALPEGDWFDPIQLATADGRLYAVDQDAIDSSIMVFDDARSLGPGPVTADREIRYEGFGSIASAYVDARDRLFVVTFTDEIFIFEGASSLDGASEPDVTLRVADASGLSAAVVDGDDRLIVADRSRSAIFVLDAISTIPSGTVVPDRELVASDLHSPRGLFLAPE